MACRNTCWQCCHKSPAAATVASLLLTSFNVFAWSCVLCHFAELLPQTFDFRFPQTLSRHCVPATSLMSRFQHLPVLARSFLATLVISMLQCFTAACSSPMSLQHCIWPMAANPSKNLIKEFTYQTSTRNRLRKFWHQGRCCRNVVAVADNGRHYPTPLIHAARRSPQWPCGHSRNAAYTTWIFCKTLVLAGLLSTSPA